MDYDVNDEMVMGIGQLKVLISFDTLVHLSLILQHIDQPNINFIPIWSGPMVAFLALIRGQCRGHSFTNLSKLSGESVSPGLFKPAAPVLLAEVCPYHSRGNHVSTPCLHCFTM